MAISILLPSLDTRKPAAEFFNSATGPNKKSLGKKKKVKNIVRPTKEKERYEDSERKAGIFEKSVPLAECYEIPKRTGLPVAGQTMR